MTNAQLPPLVVFGEDWGAHPSSTQHLMKQLCAETPVIWLNSIGMRRPKLTLKDMRRAVGKLSAMLRPSGFPESTGDPAAKQAPSAFLNPRTLPLPGSAIARRINGYSLGSQVRQTLQRLELDKPILWLSLPTAVDAVGKCGESAVIYYAGDDFSALAGVDHGPVERMEAELAEKADVIIAASATIAKRFAPDKTFIIPHGCDTALFSSPQPSAADLTGDRPVAGFYGSINSWLDQDLLIHAAQRLPDWRFLMVGQVETDVSRMQAVPNIEFTGRKPHSELPRLSQHWQASLLPFRDTRQIRACNPLKLREYLAAGRPVVSTRFPAVEEYSNEVTICDHRDAFVAGIENALRSDTEGALARQERVSRETWQARAGEVRTLIEALQNATMLQFATEHTRRPEFFPLNTAR